MGSLADAIRSGVALDSATGVELRLPIAGPGARAFAYLLDWHVRLVLAAAWYTLAAVIYNGQLSIAAPLDPEGAWFALVVSPAAGIYFLYHFVLELAMHGRTPGKRVAGVRLVAHTGGVPGAGQILTRNVFRLIDSFPVFYGVGLVTAFATRERVRVGDLAAGTLLVYERTASSLFAHVDSAAFRHSLRSSELEVLNDLLQRWDAIAASVRARLAAELLARSAAPDESEPATDVRARLERLAQGVESA